MARPKITTKNFPADWQVEVILMMGQGASRVEAQAYLNIADGTWARLMKEDKEFLRTIKKGKRLCQAWWERQGRTSMRDKDFSAVLWYMNMKNRFGWRDKIDHTTKDEKIAPLESSKIAKDIYDLIKGNTKSGGESEG